jgi:hypothetical protein
MSRPPSTKLMLRHPAVSTGPNRPASGAARSGWASRRKERRMDFMGV